MKEERRLTYSTKQIDFVSDALKIRLLHLLLVDDLDCIDNARFLIERVIESRSRAYNMHTLVHLTESTATEFFLYDIFIIESLAWDTTTLSDGGLGMIRNSRVDGILEVVIGPTDRVERAAHACGC